MFVLYGFVARSGATELRHRPVPGFVLVRRNLDTGLCLVLFWYGETLTQACTWFSVFFLVKNFKNRLRVPRLYTQQLCLQVLEEQPN